MGIAGILVVIVAVHLHVWCLDRANAWGRPLEFDSLGNGLRLARLVLFVAGVAMIGNAWGTVAAVMSGAVSAFVASLVAAPILRQLKLIAPKSSTPRSSRDT